MFFGYCFCIRVVNDFIMCVCIIYLIEVILRSNCYKFEENVFEFVIFVVVNLFFFFLY